MKPWLNLTTFSFWEVCQGRVYKILLAAILLMPLLAIMLSSLFLFDIGKVYIDAVIALTHVLMIIYILFVCVSLLARDIEQKVCYLLLAYPAGRISYVCGRFAGFLLALFVLLLALSVVNAAVGEWYIGSMNELYRSDFSWQSLVAIITLHAFQYIAILGVVFFIFSWATGAAEIMLFSSVVILFSWVFPPILLAMQRQDVAAKVPGFLQQFLDVIYQALPHLNGGSIALELSHAKALQAGDIGVYLLEHVAYAGVMLMLALWKFSKRDL
ncbi:MAG: hypothetical protein R8M45_08430 [Ghiorsea sp.]